MSKTEVFLHHTPVSQESLALLDQGVCQIMIADYEGARGYHERALTLNEKLSGGEHPLAASSLNNLGELLRALGDYEGARPYYERALAILEQKLGLEHPHTKILRRNLEWLLKHGE